ncbi:MAG: ribonuclease Z, partial [Prevotella sp.]|nr:ribonuclease Z [Prevotella sp.]
GEEVPHERLVIPADPPRAYAFCSDTRYMPELYKVVEGVDLLYHESTYCEDRADRAELYHHSTAAQAATVAKQAHVKKLILGHYSARYNDEEQIVKEARSIFPESYLTAENDVFEL